MHRLARQCRAHLSPPRHRLSLGGTTFIQILKLRNHGVYHGIVSNPWIPSVPPVVALVLPCHVHPKQTAIGAAATDDARVDAPFSTCTTKKSMMKRRTLMFDV